jgi:hypothetical protein
LKIGVKMLDQVVLMLDARQPLGEARVVGELLLAGRPQQAVPELGRG